MLCPLRILDHPSGVVELRFPPMISQETGSRHEGVGVSVVLDANKKQHPPANGFRKSFLSPPNGVFIIPHLLVYTTESTPC
jgi:hypothetical protein